MISFRHSGDFNNIEMFFKKSTSYDYLNVLKKYGEQGVKALMENTPIDSGKTASSWGFTIDVTRKSTRITWTNDNIVDGVPIAIIIQYGHGTGTGGYVQGVDYINPALKPIFDEMLNEIWGEVTK